MIKLEFIVSVSRIELVKTSNISITAEFEL
jgi:hypothetical protein